MNPCIREQSFVGVTKQIQVLPRLLETFRNNLNTYFEKRVYPYKGIGLSFLRVAHFWQT